MKSSASSEITTHFWVFMLLFFRFSWYHLSRSITTWIYINHVQRVKLSFHSNAMEHVADTISSYSAQFISHSIIMPNINSHCNILMKNRYIQRTPQYDGLAHVFASFILIAAQHNMSQMLCTMVLPRIQWHLYHSIQFKSNHAQQICFHQMYRKQLCYDVW